MRKHIKRGFLATSMGMLPVTVAGEPTGESPRMVYILRTYAAIARSAKDNREAERIDRA